MKLISLYKNILEFLSTVLIFILFGNVILQIFSRTFLTNTPAWTTELGSYLLVWLVAIGSGLLFIVRNPIGLDFLMSKLSDKGKKVLRLVIVLFSSWFVLTLAYGSLQLVEKGKTIHTTALKWPMSYVYSGLTVTASLIFVSMLLMFLKALKNKGEKPNNEY